MSTQRASEEKDNSRASSDDLRAPLEKPLTRLAEPFRNLVSAQEASGWLLLTVTVFAVAAANSPLAEPYFAFLGTYAGFEIGDYALKKTLLHWVNDALMALFFFLLGLELKREILTGQLSEGRRALSVVCAAAGGMLMPILLYLMIANSPEVSSGWGIPVATDTAFALMVLMLLGTRVPPSARAFIVGLAIIDDLGAITIIAVAYSENLQLHLTAPLLTTVGLLALLNIAGVRRGLPYFVVGCVLWGLVTAFGIHGTLAGVITAMAAPVRPEMKRPTLVDRLQGMVTRIQREGRPDAETLFGDPKRLEVAGKIRDVADAATPPLNKWEDRLERPISFIVMPLFAFMNAGISLSADLLDVALASSLTWAIAAGLVVGKPLGILLGIALGRQLGLARLPAGLGWSAMFGLGLLAGIGFTMSLFITTLSFSSGQMLGEVAKFSVIASSLTCGVLGYLILRSNRVNQGEEP